MRGWRNIRGQVEPITLLIYLVVLVIVFVILLKVLDRV
jgi:hypothetical protein